MEAARRPARAFAYRALRNIGSGSAASVWLDVRGPDHLGPFVGLIGDEPAEVGRRARDHHAAPILNPLSDFGIGKGRVYFLIEFLDDPRWCGLRRADAVPAGYLVARQKTLHGRDVRQ